MTRTVMIASLMFVMSLRLSGTTALAETKEAIRIPIPMTDATRQELTRKVIDAIQPSVPFQITPSMIRWDLRHPEPGVTVMGPDARGGAVFVKVTHYGKPEFAAVALRIRRMNPGGYRYIIMDHYLADEGYLYDYSKDTSQPLRVGDTPRPPGIGARVTARSGASRVQVDGPSFPVAKVEEITRRLLLVVAALPQPSLEAATEEYVRRVLHLDETSETPNPVATLELVANETASLLKVRDMIAERDKLAPGAKIPLAELLKYFPSDFRFVKTKADVLGNPYPDQWDADPDFNPFHPKTSQFFGIEVPSEHPPHPPGASHDHSTPAPLPAMAKSSRIAAPERKEPPWVWGAGIAALLVIVVLALKGRSQRRLK